MNTKIIRILTLVMVCLLPLRSQLKVVTTIPDLKSITELVGGDRVEVFAIAAGYQNPHFVDPKPSYILKLAKADMFVTVGLDLEIGWVPPLLNSARNPNIQKGGAGYVDASVGVPLLQVPSSADRGAGDIHIYGNPHYWLDPMNGIIIARTIAATLTRLDPAHADEYAGRLSAFSNTIERKMKEWSSRLPANGNVKVIAYHNEWPYFERRFGLNIVGFLEPKPGIPPTPSQLSDVIETMKRERMSIIITSMYFKAESAELVARNTGGTVVTLATSVGARPEITTYYDLFDYNVAQIRSALERRGDR